MKCQFDDSISPNDYLQYEADSSSLECLHKGDVGNIVRDAYDTREISKKPNLYKGAFQLGKQVEKDETTVHPSKTAVGATFLAAFLAHVDTEQSRTTDLRLELSTKWLKPDRIDVLSTVPLARTISNYFAPNKAVVQEADLSQPTAFADINKRFSSRDADIVQLDPTAHPPVKNIRKAHIEIQKGKRLAPEPIDFDDII